MLTETPFSVTIVIKKSFTRSKDANSMQLLNIDQSISKPVAKQELYKNFSRQKKILSSFLLDQNIRSQVPSIRSTSGRFLLSIQLLFITPSLGHPKRSKSHPSPTSGTRTVQNLKR